MQIAPPVDAPPDIVHDIAPDAAVTISRGGACSESLACAPGLECLGASLYVPGGYCASTCAKKNQTCDGACAPMTRYGAVCLQGCTTDADCRAQEGYVCDATWRACVTPNSLAIALRSCPAPAPKAIPARDRSFGAPVTLDARSPIAVVGPAGVFALPASDRRRAPSLARDRKGILYATWLDPARDNPEVLLSRSRDGGTTWSEPDRVDDPADCIAYDTRRGDCLAEPTVVIGPNPEIKGDEVVYVLYGAADGLRVRSSRDEGATFRAAVTALPGTIASAEVSADGALHVIAIESLSGIGVFGSANHQINYSVSRDVGRTFARPIRLDRRDELLPVYFARPQIAIDTRRRSIYALYVRGGRDGIWDLMLLASKDAGATWKRTRIGDEPACAIHMVPQLALDPARGTLHVAWYDNRGGGRFAHATCTPGAQKCTQHGAINDAPFAMSAERLTPASIEERATLIVDDKRRTLHAVWAEVTTGGMRVQHASAKLR
ncbi:MAG: sialidase family protein [Kofleriaceae bacterium]